MSLAGERVFIVCPLHTRHRQPEPLDWLANLTETFISRSWFRLLYLRVVSEHIGCTYVRTVSWGRKKKENWRDHLGPGRNGHKHYCHDGSAADSTTYISRGYKCHTQSAALSSVVVFSSCKTNNMKSGIYLHMQRRLKCQPATSHLRMKIKRTHFFPKYPYKKRKKTYLLLYTALY